MRVFDVIDRKRTGGENTTEEIMQMVVGFSQGHISPEEMSAWLMAICLNGMTALETMTLTKAMLTSGEQLSWFPEAGEILVDKHSTGGVGDKTTLIVAPIVASAGVKVIKLSGKGLGHTGGTIDKLAAINGLKTDLMIPEIVSQVTALSLYIGEQTANLAPADKYIYALRNKTATIESIPLIASSIMSKKLATGADKIVLDVKYGSGAFMKTKDEAVALAKTMVQIGHDMGHETVAIISNMDQPLGYHIGNWLEVQEAMAVLQGAGPKDLRDLSIAISAHMFVLAGRVTDIASGETLACQQIANGEASQTMLNMFQAQGGNISWDDLKNHEYDFSYAYYSEVNGYIQAIGAKRIGEASMMLGAGRSNYDEEIDYQAGIILHKKIGEHVFVGETIATLYYQQSHVAHMQQALAKVVAAIQIGHEEPVVEPLIAQVILQ